MEFGQNDDPVTFHRDQARHLEIHLGEIGRELFTLPPFVAFRLKPKSWVSERATFIEPG